MYGVIREANNPRQHIVSLRVYTNKPKGFLYITTNAFYLYKAYIVTITM